ncbi:hypothetical protein GYMLUDRAFT_243847 [Collybiopsis luxurians FD-317 M1]|uniref:MFS general substrate transporter n=1 Tax=Collybiopsis luxurians FD-317 M1 TaxID=944289 RepID=A0A0D0BBT9_9AGAR|nr:hypothetical protein GYMLUDRAFT_243847 [Collybiopsis luxurians FD-317 M1]
MAHDDRSSRKSSGLLSDVEVGSGPSVKRSWLYSTFTQAFVIGGVAFLAPGMYNALSGLGAGGLASTHTWNIATALLFSLLCVTCVFGGIIINQIGLKWSLAISACFYAIYAASLYENSKDGNEWFLIFANVLLGIASGMFFATEGAVVVGYPEEHNRGRYISVWVFMRNLGPIVGGAILLGLNVTTNGTGSISLQSYAAFVGIMCGAPFVALLLATPDKVQRNDGTRVVFHKTSWKSELKSSWRFISSKKILMLLPIFFASWFYDSFMTNYTADYFSVRARALSSFLTPFGGNFGSLFIGWIIDSGIGSRKTRALAVFAGLIVFQYALWIWTSINMVDYLDSNPVFDWSTSGFGRAYALVFFVEFRRIGVTIILVLAQWDCDLHELVHVTGILRGIEGAGQAVAYGLSSSTASKWVHIGLNMGLIAVSVIPAWMVIREVPDGELGRGSHETADALGNELQNH